MCGPWVDFSTDKRKGPGKPGYVHPKNPAQNGEVSISDLLKKNSTRVMKADGTIVTFDGTNAAEMVGFYMPTNAQPRNDFYEKNYLNPIGKQDISNYAQKGYTLTQTKGWEHDN